jgi:hypothetical protein
VAVAAIDTHEVVKDLQAAGFTEGQAEAVSRVVLQARSVDLSNLATKADLAETRAGLQTSIAETRARLETSIAETKTEILKWMVSTIGLQTVVIIGAVITLVRLLH